MIHDPTLHLCLGIDSLLGSETGLQQLLDLWVYFVRCITGEADEDVLLLVVI